MLSTLARRVVVFLVAAGLACFCPTATAQTSQPSMQQAAATKLQSEKKKKKKINVKVDAQKGAARGVMSVFSRNSGGGRANVVMDVVGTSKRKFPIADRNKAIDACFRVSADIRCFFEEDDTMANAGLLTGSLARAIAVTLVTELRLPTPTPKFGPDPDNNEWKMLAVGFPVWLWTDGPTSVSTSASASGFTFRMSARLRSTTFHMGDGSSITCTSMSTYSSAVKPGAPSPDCGHVYTQPSLPKGKYTVRAVADWDVSWSVAGFSGVIPAYNDATATIPIGELVALNR